MPWQPDARITTYLAGQIELKFLQGEKVSYIDSSDTKAGITSPEKPALPSKALITDCAKIAAFLMDENACVKQLRKLNNLLEEQLGDNPQGANIVFVLRQILEEELSQFGFKPMFAKSLDLLEPEVFRSLLRDGLILKDAAIDPDHGEFIHAIQWLIIAWQNEESKFLSEATIEVFQQLGDEQAVFLRRVDKKLSTIRNETVLIERNIWDLIVDLDQRTDFRSPEEVTRFLLQDKSTELKVLRDVLQQRQTKRNQEPDDKLPKKYSSANKPGDDADTAEKDSNLFFRKENRGAYRKGKRENVLEPEAVDEKPQVSHKKSSV